MKKLLLVLALLLPRPVAAQIIPPSQTISVQDTGTQCATANTCAQWQLPNTAPSFTVQITGTFSGTLTFRGSADGISFFDILATKVSTGVQATTTTTTGQFALVNPGIVALRVVGTTVNSGGANLTLTRGSASSSSRAFPSFGSFATGDLLYASAANVISGLADVAAGSYLRSGGVGVAPLWSTLVLPNAATTGDILTATSANTVGVVAAVATGQVLASAGTSTAPAYTATPTVTSATASKTVGVTSADGLVASNPTAAAAGAQQWSPRLRFGGFGWGTGAGTSQASDCILENQISQASVPTPDLVLKCNIGGGALVNVFDFLLSNTAVPSLFMGTNGSMNAGSGGNIGWNGRTLMKSAADGALNFTNSTSNGFTSLSLNSDLIYSYATPTITSGFSTTTPSIAGKASAFAVTIAATPGVTGTVAFNATFTNVPSCSCTNTITANAVQCVPTVTTAVINGVWVANDILRCLVIGY